MSVLRSISIAILIGIFISLTGCNPNKEALKQHLNFPGEFVIDGFDSDSNRSALHGPMYFSFLSNDENFKKIIGLNDLPVIQVVPEAYDFIMEEAIKFAALEVWPSLGRIDRYKIYSNHEDINPDKQEHPSLLMTFHIEETMYVIVFPLY